MKRYILFLLCVVISGSAFAQQLNVFCTGPDGNPLPGVTLYSFNVQKKAYTAMADLKDPMKGFVNKDELDCLAEETSGSDGSAVLKCSMTGYIVVDAVNAEILVNVVGEMKAVRLDTVFVIHVPKYRDGADVRIKVPRKMDARVTDLRQVDKVSLPPMPEPGQGISVRHGLWKTVSKEVELESKYTRGGARYVLSPRINLPNKKDSLMCYLSPAVVDGLEYEEKLFVRRGYDWKNDKLHTYKVDSALHMQNNRGERIVYTATFGPVTPGEIYRVVGDSWFEDFKSVYHRDSVLISDGNDREPMRFLNWDDAKKAVPIQRELYRKVEHSESMSYPMDFHMEFETGSDVLDLSDTVTAMEWDRLCSWLKTYYSSDDSEINSIVVTAYSSPEGSYERNKQLSHARTNGMVRRIQSTFPKVSGAIHAGEYDRTDNIVPWSTVADTLATLPGLRAAEYAASIRDIVERNGSFDAQQRDIASHSERWQFLKDSVLKRVRRVEIKAEVTTVRILTMDEIIEKYRTDPNFHKGIGLKAYQYYNLMCWLFDQEDWDGLYTIAKAAYESEEMKQYRIPRQNFVPFEQCSVEDQEKAREEDEAQGRPLRKSILRTTYVSRPDPLAGFYLANCLLRQNKYDTELLSPFLDDSRLGRPARVDGRSIPVFNDPAIVTMQVLMHCVKQDFQEANNLIIKYNLSDERFKQLRMFVSCLAGGYLEDPEVRAYVAASSPMNKAVILAALDDYKGALNVLGGEDIPQDDPRVFYLRAICRFHSLPPARRNSKVKFYNSSGIYNADGISSARDASGSDFASPMLEALRRDPANQEYLKTDGYFTQPYRQLVFYFWKRLSDGLTEDKIATEYDALVKKYNK